MTETISFIIAILSTLITGVVSIFTVYVQSKTNEDNNKRLLEIEKLNNENQLKLKRLDYYYSEKSSVIFKYLDDLFDYLNNPSPLALKKYQSSTYKVCMFVSGDAYTHIEYINNYINDGDFKNAKHHVEFLMGALSSDSKQYK